MKNRKKIILFTLLGIIALIVITIGAFFGLFYGAFKYVKSSSEKDIGTQLDCPIINKLIEHRQNLGFNENGVSIPVPEEQLRFVEIKNNEFPGWETYYLNENQEEIPTDSLTLECYKSVGENPALFNHYLCYSQSATLKGFIKKTIQTRLKLWKKEKTINVSARYLIINNYNSDESYIKTYCSGVEILNSEK